MSYFEIYPRRDDDLNLLLMGRMYRDSGIGVAIDQNDEVWVTGKDIAGSPHFWVHYAPLEHVRIFGTGNRDIAAGIEILIESEDE